MDTANDYVSFLDPISSWLIKEGNMWFWSYSGWFVVAMLVIAAICLAIGILVCRGMARGCMSCCGREKQSRLERQ